MKSTSIAVLRSCHERHRMRAACAQGALALTALAAASGSWATTAPPYVVAGVDIGSGLTGTQNHDSGLQALPSVSETGSVAGASPNGSTVTASGNASADAFGNLKVESTASISVVAADWPGVGIYASAVADRADTFHFLPAAGTTISFLATLEWSGPLTPQCPAGTDCIVNVTNQLLDLDHGGAAMMQNSWYYDSADPNHNTLPPGTVRLQQVWTFSSPASYDLEEELIAEVQISGLGAAGSITADLSHTGHFYLDPLTPGSTYTTASGNLYYTPSPVPEPASWAMLGAGLLMAASAARRRI